MTDTLPAGPRCRALTSPAAAGRPTHTPGAFVGVTDPHDPHHPDHGTHRPESARHRSSSGTRRPPHPLVAPFRRNTPTVVLVIAAVSAVLAALSPAEPVGLRLADAVWCGLLGAVVPLAASRARRWALAWLGGIAAIVGIGGDGVAIVFAVGSIAATLAVAASKRRDRLVGALLGAVAVQALLRGPSYGFIGLPTLVGLAAIVPVLVTGYRMARSRERRVARWGMGAVAALVIVGSVAAAGAAALARPSLEDGRSSATDGLDALGGGDTPGATAAFVGASLDFGDANGTLSGPLSWVGRAVPVVSQHVEALQQVSAAGKDLGTTAAETASTTDYRGLTAANGQVDLQKIAALQAPVAEAAVTIEDAQAQVDALDSPWLASLVTDELDDFRTELADVSEQTRRPPTACASPPPCSAPPDPSATSSPSPPRARAATPAGSPARSACCAPTRAASSSSSRARAPT